ncbi:hypothetical protein GDO86_004743, partial [Hymenochirus boettgeri]
NCCDPGKEGDWQGTDAPRAVWLVTTLSSVLIFTTVVDLIGNLLVIISVLRNRKLRNSGKETGKVVFSVHQVSTKLYNWGGLLCPPGIY